MGLIAADASPLIALAKMERLGLLQAVYGEVTVAPTVKIEVLDQGKEIAAPGIEQVEDALQTGWLQVARLTRGERNLLRKIVATSRLDQGEAESIAVARSRGLLVMLDDKEARAHAELLRVEYVGTAGFLLEAFLKRHLTMTGLEQAVQDLSSVMWLSPAVVTEILRRAREARK
jgi:predicted nucleic acid-binding protein